MFVSVYIPQSKLTAMASFLESLQVSPCWHTLKQVSSHFLFQNTLSVASECTSTKYTSLAMQQVHACMCMQVHACVYSCCVYTAIGSYLYMYSRTDDYRSLPMPGRTRQTGHSSSHLVAQLLSVVSSPHITEASQTLLYNRGAAFSMS